MAATEDILVIAPHPDDESIGCGGAIALHSGNGDRVKVLFLTSGEIGLKMLPREQAWNIREREARDAASVLGFEIARFCRLPDYALIDHLSQAAEAVGSFLVNTAFSRIYLPHPNESHPDHAAVSPILQLAFKITQVSKPWLLGYEVWTPLGSFDYSEDITAVQSVKQQAVRCYPSQLKEFAYDRAVHGLNCYRGALAQKCEFAEVFESLSL